MKNYVETIIAWRHNLRRNIGAEVLDYIKQKNVYVTYLEILSEIDYGIMMEKEYAFELNGRIYAHIQQYPKKDLNILCTVGLLKSSKEISGYYELVMDKSKFKAFKR